MRALVKRGFCISVGNYAEVGKVVELEQRFYDYMYTLHAVEPAPPTPEEQAAADKLEAAADKAQAAEDKKLLKANPNAGLSDPEPPSHHVKGKRT